MPLGLELVDLPVGRRASDEQGRGDGGCCVLERALAQKDTGLLFIKQEVLFASLEDDPRYALFLRKMKLPI